MTPLPIARPRILPDLLDAVGARYPDTLSHFPAGRSVLSRAQWMEGACRAAGALQQLGIRQGELVGLLLATSPDFTQIFFGVIRAGGIPVVLPLPAAFGYFQAYLARLRHILADARIATIVSHPRFIRIVGQRAGSVRFLTPDDLSRVDARPRCIALRGADLAFVQYTSGSTAVPKGIALTHDNILASVAAIAHGMRATPEDVYCQWLPLSHDMGLISLLTTMATGATQHLWPPAAFIQDPAEWLFEFARCGGTVYAGPDFSYDHMLASVAEDRLPALDLSRWRIAFNGAEPINAHRLEKFTRYFGRVGFRPEAMFPVYGLAEATLAVTFPDLGTAPVIDWVDRVELAGSGQVVKVPRGHPLARGLVAVGRAVLGHRIRIIGADGRWLGERRVGEIHVQGPAVMTGYYRRPEETRRVLAAGWLRTGDLGYVSDGLLFITGRTKELIIVRGMNIYPEDVEALVRETGGVYQKRCVAFGTGGSCGERMGVAIETDLADAPARAQLAGSVWTRVSSYLGIQSLDVYLLKPRSLPRTSSGKYQRLLTRTNLATGELGGRILGAFTELSIEKGSAA
jgi:fatty-acyl-CoA synthase